MHISHQLALNGDRVWCCFRSIFQFRPTATPNEDAVKNELTRNKLALGPRTYESFLRLDSSLIVLTDLVNNFIALKPRQLLCTMYNRISM